MTVRDSNTAFGTNGATFPNDRPATSKSSVALDLPDTVPHDFDPELRADAQRLDATFRELLIDLRATDLEHEAQQSSLDSRRKQTLRDDEYAHQNEKSAAEKAQEAARTELQSVQGVLSVGRRHPILDKVLGSPTNFPGKIDHPTRRFNEFTSAFHKQKTEGNFYTYSPASSSVRAVVFAVTAGGLTWGAYLICRDTGLFPIVFILLALWSCFAALVVTLRFVRGNDDKFDEPYTQLMSLLNAIEGIFPHVLNEIEETHRTRLSRSAARYDSEEQTLTETFVARYDVLKERWRVYTAESDEIAPPWDSAPLRSAWFAPDGTWKAAEGLPRAVRLGAQKVRVLAETIEPPLLVPFPGGVSLLFETAGAEKARALEGIQAIMLRLLATIPPGKLRFTLFDPVGLGQNVAPFMHLADHDDTLVTARAWTEPNHIEQRLTDLSEHMELVIQKYLRNEYPSMEAYNKKAEMVEEPYRILVVANFPVNFTESAAKRLVSIATNGPRCGVYTLITVDREQPLPHGFNLADLERASTVITTTQDAFWLQDTELGGVPLRLDAPPQPDLFNRIVERVGDTAKRQAGVQVPYSRIKPRRDQWWSSSTSAQIRAPIGISGAAGKQEFAVGTSTRQHALLAGRTGSGKSTLLHVLITTLALQYSPDELELYLIDFKKGVEFKTYAKGRLPHARVIAIESEREFGLSVLQGLDEELTARGTLFRKTADELAVDVQNLATYRERTGKTLPRIVLIVDEFQEFFADDDPLANRVAQILDRLVRQGRGFGIHVVLGSQTLSGAYSLNRGTLDQMGIRIALQCSEADSRLILSEDNPAARLLSRPGEAIYNHANGMLEGNNRFQTVWLSDDERDELLGEIAHLEEDRRAKGAPVRQTIVFEGQELATIDTSPTLNELVDGPTWPATAPRAVQCWLGEAVAIKPPTAATFRSQPGSNVLVVGQDEEAALGITSSVLLSLGAQYAPNQVRIIVSDLSLEDGPYHAALDPVLDALPHKIERAPRRRIVETVEALAAEVKNRIAADTHVSIPTYFIVHGLMRARDLRVDDEAPYGRFGGYGALGEDEPAPKLPPAELLTRILRDGPEVGVHLIAWADTLGNAQRTLDRTAMREFDMRVVFQMSADDSGSLVDSPLASRLGQHRALFFSEERGLLEKFRPYALPDATWLAKTQTSLATRQTADPD